MLKRLAIYCMALLAVGFIIVGYFWFEERQVRAEVAKKTKAFLEEEIAQKNGFESLGIVDIDPSGLNLQKLEERLHQPAQKKPGAQNSTRLGWVCGSTRCAIWASFLVPSDQEIPPSTNVAGLTVTSPLAARFPNSTFGGIYLGGTVEELERTCQNRGYGQSLGYHHVRWDQNWDLRWADTSGKVSILMFTNEGVIRKAVSGLEGNASAPAGVGKKDTR